MHIQLPPEYQRKLLSTVTGVIDLLDDGLHKINFDLEILKDTGLLEVVETFHDNIDSFIAQAEQNAADDREHRKSVRSIYNENKL